MKFVPSSVTRAVSKQVLQAQQKSPTLLFGAGVVGMVATTVLASRATLRLETVLVEHEKMSGVIEENVIHNSAYSQADRDHDQKVLYIQTAVKVTKLYAPALATGVISIAFLTKSHSILQQRNAGLTAAYIAVDRAFSEYRERVAEEVGEEREREIRHNIREVEITEYNEKGERTGRKKVKKADGSVYSRLWGRDTSPEWDPIPEYNVANLRVKQQALNNRLQARGYLFLNEAYEALGLAKTSVGQQVGWIYDPNDKDRDSFVDFGAYDEGRLERFMDFVTGREDCILLDFNVDGKIIHILDEMALRK